MNLNNLKSIYIYPNYKGILSSDSNDYLSNLRLYLSKYYKIINREGSSLGLLDILMRFRKIRIIYLNWIENLPDKSFGPLQIIILMSIILLSKICNVKIVWFVHNNISHSKTNLYLKSFITRLMIKYADCILSHSSEVKLEIPANKFYMFPHPIETRSFIRSRKYYKYDLLIWGRISEYKGIADFLKYNYDNFTLKDFKIIVAGKFSSTDYKRKVLSYKTSNVTILEGVLEENELIGLMSDSKYVLFTYNSSSVLSSGALCHTLSYGKQVIGPSIGCFIKHGKNGRIINYKSYEDISTILKVGNNDLPPISLVNLKNYISKVGWEDFADFLFQTFRNSFK